jgi:signal transduction histidine kinase
LFLVAFFIVPPLEVLLKNTIAEQVKLKEKAIEAEQAKSRFLSTMSHEIRTPRNSILRISVLLRDEKLSEDNLDPYIVRTHLHG